jgi:hypothetical protein
MDWASLGAVQYARHPQPECEVDETTPPDVTAEEDPASAFNPGIWVVLFLVLVLLCQLALLLPGIGPLRMLVRMAVFAASLSLLLVTTAYGKRHPAAPAVVLVLVIYLLQVMHPYRNTMSAALAQGVLNLAIMAPLFWAPRLGITPRCLRTGLLTLWGFHTISAALGVLQTMFPGSFQPQLSSVVTAVAMEGYLESLMITTASGEKVFRPMGLSDIPGGAANSAFYCLLLGVGFLLSERGWGFRVLCGVAMVVGAVALLLSQVRSMLVMLILCLGLLMLLLIRRGDLARMTLLGIVLGGLAVVSLLGAIALGGSSVTGRLSSLVSESPTDVYQTNRGVYLTLTIEELLPRYYLGAGLGRWGMMNAYFGDNSDVETEKIWVEIQWTGWLLDGGVPLILAYLGSLLIALRTSYRIATRREGTVPVWAAVICAYSVSVLALSFSYPVFISQNGMEFWLLNGAIFRADTLERGEWV